MLDKSNFLSMEYISGRIKYENNIDDTTLIFIIAHVYDWYDETIRLEGNFKIEENSLLFKINNGLESGLYEILSIKDTKGNIIAGNENINGKIKLPFLGKKDT